MKKKKYYTTNILIWIVLLCLYCIFLVITVTILTIKFNTWFAIIIILLFFLLLYIGYVSVYRRGKHINKLFKLYTEGFLADELLQGDLNISKTISEMLRILSERIDKSKNLNVSMKEAQYLALQNQINPHFLYNTLESIRSEALIAGMDGVASMTETLATYFRYTISNLDRLVTLEDELSNVECYYVIQQYRFGDKLNLSIEYDDEIDELSVLNLRMPKLILQPIVENSIYHGIERKLGKGNLRIKIECTNERLIICISDDGMGMKPELVNNLNNKLMTNPLDSIEYRNKSMGGIAIINVNNRIRLLFGKKYGIYIYSTLNVGTDVVITLPVIQDDVNEEITKGSLL